MDSSHTGNQASSPTDQSAAMRTRWFAISVATAEDKNHREAKRRDLMSRDVAGTDSGGIQ